MQTLVPLGQCAPLVYRVDNVVVCGQLCSSPVVRVSVLASFPALPAPHLAHVVVLGGRRGRQEQSCCLVLMGYNVGIVGRVVLEGF